MAEGAILPWKVQKLNAAPSLSYSCIQKPLLAPKGRRWSFDPVRKEWSLADAEEPPPGPIEVDPISIVEENDDEFDHDNDRGIATIVVAATAAVTTKGFGCGGGGDDDGEDDGDDDDRALSVPAPAFVEHRLSPSDTFQDICLMYKITPLELRRANGGFRGKNMSLVPNPLLIPRGGAVSGTTAVAVEVEGDLLSLTEDKAIEILLKECRHGMSRSEAKAYLMLNKWDLNEAFRNAQDDGF